MALVVVDTPVEGSLFYVSNSAFHSHSLKVVSAVDRALRRVPVNGGACRSPMLSNMIIDITFPRRSLVFSQSCCEVSFSLSDVGGVAVGVTDLIGRSLSVLRLVLVC